MLSSLLKSLKSLKKSSSVKLRVPFSEEQFRISGSTIDGSIFQVIHDNQGLYEPHLMRALEKVLKPGAVVLDIGANIGVISIAMSRLIKDNGKIFAFEASRANFSFLEKNLRQNSIKNVHPLQLGVFDKRCELDFNFIETRAGCSYITVNDRREGTRNKIQCVDLDSWAKENKIERLDLIKLDVEGAEIHVLNGAKELLKKTQPILAIELNPETLHKFFGKETRELYDILVQYYPRMELVRADADGVIPIRSYNELMKILEAGRGWEDMMCYPSVH